MPAINLLQARDSVTGTVYTWTNAATDGTGFPGPNSPEEIALLAKNGVDVAEEVIVSITKAADHTVTLADYGGRDPATTLLRVYVTANATITLPSDSSLVRGCSVEVIKVGGSSFACNVDSGTTPIQFDSNGTIDTDGRLFSVTTTYQFAVTWTYSGTAWLTDAFPRFPGWISTASIATTANTVLGDSTGAGGTVSRIEIAENELVGRETGGNVGGKNLAEFSADVSGTVAYPGFFDVQTTASFSEFDDFTTHTVDLSGLGDGVYKIVVMILATDESGTRYRQSYSLDLERTSGTLSGDELAAPVVLGGTDSQSAEPSGVTFANASGDLAITCTHTVTGEEMALTTAVSLVFLPYPSAPFVP